MTTAPVTACRGAHTSRRARTLGGLGAVFGAILIWLVAVPLLGVQLQVPLSSGAAPIQIGLPYVVVTALLAALAGWGLLTLLERRTPRSAQRTWMITAAVVLAVSLVPLLGMETFSATRVTLSLMHLQVGATLMAAVAWHASPDTR